MKIGSTAQHLLSATTTTKKNTTTNKILVDSSETQRGELGMVSQTKLCVIYIERLIDITA